MIRKIYTRERDQYTNSKGQREQSVKQIIHNINKLRAMFQIVILQIG